MNDVIVPCGSCTACCRNQVVILFDEDEPNRAKYKTRLIANPSLEALEQKPNGECAHLGPGGCEIYDHRPVMCRAYDCRAQFLSMSRKERRRFFKKSEIFKAARERLGL